MNITRIYNEIEIPRRSSKDELDSAYSKGVEDALAGVPDFFGGDFDGKDTWAHDSRPLKQSIRERLLKN